MNEEHPEINPWGRNLKVPVLRAGVVHLWMFSLDQSEMVLNYCSSLLSEDEKVRAAKFYFAGSRRQFILVRGALRNLLGAYLGMDPEQVEFAYEQHGKPMLKDGISPQPIRFNVSHAEDWGVTALCLEQRVGVDIEYIRAMPDMNDLARRFFTANESTLLESFEGEEKNQIFYKLWTCKEAYLKASGEGLFLPLDQVEIHFEAEGRVQLRSKHGTKMTEWALHLFNPQSDYQVATCVEGDPGEYMLQVCSPF